MSIQLVEIQRPDVSGEPSLTDLATISSNTESDSDGGYDTPADNFADDELQDEVHDTLSPVIAKQAESTDTPEDVVVVVDPELRERILKQVEWYFSDENLLKDSFLMKHINRNKQGYVSLKLVASFRKVKSLTKDWRVVLASVKHSSLLALSEDCRKIRRLAPAPQVDYSHVGRTVIITGYPSDEPNANGVMSQFGKFGEVILVRIFHPGKAIPLDVKPCRSKHPGLGKELCILVEYESEKDAKMACEKFRDQQSWRDNMKVELLDRPTESTKDKHGCHSQETEKPSKGKKNRNKQSNDRKKDLQDKTQWQRMKEGSPPTRFELSKESSPTLRHSREISPVNVRWVPKKHLDKTSHQKRKHGSSPELPQKYLHPEPRRDYASDSGYSARSQSQSPKSSPEPSKKFHFSSHSDGSSLAGWRTREKHMHVRDNCVIRQPIGPDGSRGFQKPKRPIRISVESC